MSSVNINNNKFNPNISNIDGMQALHQQQVDQANASVDVNSLVGTPIAAARYNPSKGEMSEFAKFQNSKTYQMMSTCLNSAGVDQKTLVGAEEIFTQALLSQKTDQDKNILIDLMRQVPQKYQEVLDKLLLKSELTKQFIGKELTEDQISSNLLQQSSVDDLPEDFKKFINLLKMAKADYEKQALTNSNKVGAVTQQSAVSNVSNAAKSDELDDIEDENEEISNSDDNNDKSLQEHGASTGVSANSSKIDNQEDSGFENKGGQSEQLLTTGNTLRTDIQIDDNVMPQQQERILQTMKPPVVLGVNPISGDHNEDADKFTVQGANKVGAVSREFTIENGAIPPANKLSTMLFLAVVLSYLQRSSILFDAIEKKSRANADIARLANQLLHKAQDLNSMMSNLSNKFKTLASDLQVIAGKYGISNASTSLTETNLGIYDLMFIEKAMKGDAPGFGTLSREEALEQLFFLKFNPPLSEKQCSDIKNFKPSADHPNDTYFSTLDSNTNQPAHDNLARTFNGAFMWDKVTRNGTTVSWRDKTYISEISTSLFGSSFDSWLDDKDSEYRSGGRSTTIPITKFNELVNSYFSGFSSIGFPKSNFNIFDAGKYLVTPGGMIDITGEVGKGAPDFFRGMTSMISGYSTNLGQNLITELQQKVANSGKESQDDWAKAMEQIQKFTDAGSQAFSAFAKAC
jgi:hypothetical protein